MSILYNQTLEKQIVPMDGIQQTGSSDILKQKNHLTIHYNDNGKYLDQFFEVWDAIQSLQFRGVNPLIANEFKRIGIEIDFKSKMEIRAIFDELMIKSRLNKGTWSLAKPLSPDVFLKSEEHMVESIFPVLYFKTSNARGEFFAKLMYWGNETSEHKRKYFGIFTKEHKYYKDNFKGGLTEIVGRLKEKVPQAQTSA